MNDIHVRTDVLRQSASDLKDAAAAVGPDGHWLDNSFTAAATMTAWESGPALKDCATAWQTHMKSAVDQLHRYAEQLHGSAHSYDQAEQEANRRLAAALTDLQGAGGPGQ
ncbi:type VII secretion target [Kitasatospora sp. NPDC089797]|uniref:type VII secretion target n=1 Tax=Kitasatospora sp. NPDC089797 TaxID=3155298 RepID=UPI00343C58CC